MKNSLHSVQEHLKNAPGSFLSHLRSKFTNRTGLVQNSKIQDELCVAILNSERLKTWLDKRAEWEMQALNLIYASFGRGLHLFELERNLDVEQKSLKTFLNEAVSEMFIWRVKCHNSHADSHIYYGFADYENVFLNLLLKNDEKLESGLWLSNERKAELHLLCILAKIQLRKISVKKDHSLSRLSKKHIADIFSNSSSLDSSVAVDCVRMLFSFLISQGWIAKNLDNSELALRPDAFVFLQKNGFRLFTGLIFWWEKERFQGKGSLLNLLKLFEKPVNALNAAQLFWPYDVCSRLAKNKAAITWANLPLPLRELWILGILKLQKKKHILAFSLTEFGESIFFAKQPKDRISEPIISNSSNFEWLLSQNNGPFRIFQMLAFAEIKNEEEPLRFTLSKESFLEGLRSNIPDVYIRDFFCWNKAVPSVAGALNEWLRIYGDSSIEKMHILRIRNIEKYKELSTHKPLRDCIIEDIPNWGFVVKCECEKKIRDILSHFSLEPSSAVVMQNLENLSKLTETEGFNLPYPASNNEPEFD
ncbi:MAG: hypothetical protein LBH25_12240 [Fibromonadaceae bacterium]|nr:hypothetical protein [Fibromonadaceae bacterium]